MREARDGAKISPTSTVQEIEKAIEHLPTEEFFKLGECFDEQRERLWDERIARDSQSDYYEPASGGDSVAFNLGQGAPHVVPEPGTWIAASLLACGAGFAGWRKRAKVS